MNTIEKKERVTTLLPRYAPNARRGFFYTPPPPPPPVQPMSPFLGTAAKSGKWLEQARQVMATAEQMRPLIDQYGPLVKNLPAMWKLYRAVQSMPDPDSPGSGPKQEDAETTPRPREKKQTAESVPWFPGRLE
ncbi:VrrA/YqfQ family protein [Domibacillus robiginosus]|uniref:VrrA/YqfQ family protein n=1 Tax=Domibacillus robiginosus TaxID=1071054 RepID=UPI0009E1C495|nr:VrrA/YqfQ family protein [Domibacillus robiginosus]